MMRRFGPTIFVVVLAIFLLVVLAVEGTIPAQVAVILAVLFVIVGLATFVRWRNR